MKKSRKMKKPSKTKKGKGMKIALGVAGVLALGGVAYTLGVNNTNTEVVEKTKIVNSEGATASVSIDVFDALASGNVNTLSEVYVYNADTGVNTIVTSGTPADLVIGVEYQAYVTSTLGYGSTSEVTSFTVAPQGNSIDLEVNKIGDYSLRVEDSAEADTALYIGAVTSAVTTDAVIVNSDATGTKITITDGFEFTVYTRFTDADNTVINDKGMLVVFDTLDADEFEDESVTFAGKTLSAVSLASLSEVDADVFKKKSVFMLPAGTDLTKSTELIVSANLVEDATITSDVKVDIYTMGYEEPSRGVDVPELTALNSSEDAIYTHNLKQITFNLAD